MAAAIRLRCITVPQEQTLDERQWFPAWVELGNFRRDFCVQEGEEAAMRGVLVGLVLVGALLVACGALCGYVTAALAP